MMYAGADVHRVLSIQMNTQGYKNSLAEMVKVCIIMFLNTHRLEIKSCNLHFLNFKLP